jgi:hypothetical protein
MGALALAAVLLAARQASGAEGFRAVIATHANGHWNSRYETVQIDASGKVQRRVGIALLVNGKPHELQVSYDGGIRTCGKGRDERRERLSMSRFHLVPLGGGASRELAPPQKQGCDTEAVYRTASIAALVGPYLSIEAGEPSGSDPDTLDMRTGKRVTMGSLDPKAPTYAKEPFKDIQESCKQYDPKARFKLYWDNEYQLSMYVPWPEPQEKCMLLDGTEPEDADFYVTGGVLKRYGDGVGELQGKAGRIYVERREKRWMLLAELGGKAVELGEVATLVGWEADANLPPEAFDAEASLAAELRLVEGLLVQANFSGGSKLDEAETLVATLKARGVPQAEALQARVDGLRNPLRGVAVELLDAGAGPARMDEVQKQFEAAGAQIVKRGPAQQPRKYTEVFVDDRRTLTTQAAARLLKLNDAYVRPLHWKSTGALVVVLGK